MEPLLISENSSHRRKLTDLVMDLVCKSAGFKRSLPAGFQSSLSAMVLTMAHIVVQEWIDQGSLQQVSFSQESLCEVRRRFCSFLPNDLRWAEDHNSQKKTRFVPGVLRQLDVKVVNHISISPGAVLGYGL